MGGQLVTVNHVALSLEAVGHAEILPAGSPLIPIALGTAQVHATLAVAEQARIANLIAVYDDEHTPLKQILEGLALS